MSLRFKQFIDLPENIGSGGFDHAAIHRKSNQLFVAHTINNTLDVINCEADQYLYSIPGLTGVAGALVSDELDLIFTSNRGENTVSIFTHGYEKDMVKVSVGMRPNGLSFDPQLGLLLAANVGNPGIPGSFTLSMVDVQRKEMVASIQVAGRTRWTIFDPRTESFFVNIADPAQIVVVEAAHPDRLARILSVPAAGPHGLDMDMERGIFYCACDSGILVALDPVNGKTLKTAELSGTPDVIFFNPARKHLYVAVGDPGVIDVFDTGILARLEIIPTEKGAHTLAFDARRNKVYAFLPQSHRAEVFFDD